MRAALKDLLINWGRCQDGDRRASIGLGIRSWDSGEKHLAPWNGHLIPGTGGRAGDKGIIELTAASAGLRAKTWNIYFLECIPRSHCTEGTSGRVKGGRGHHSPWQFLYLKLSLLLNWEAINTNLSLSKHWLTVWWDRARTKAGTISNSSIHPELEIWPLTNFHLRACIRDNLKNKIKIKASTNSQTHQVVSTNFLKLFACQSQSSTSSFEKSYNIPPDLDSLTSS